MIASHFKGVCEKQSVLLKNGVITFHQLPDVAQKNEPLWCISDDSNKMCTLCIVKKR